MKSNVSTLCLLIQEHGDNNQPLSEFIQECRETGPVMARRFARAISTAASKGGNWHHNDIQDLSTLDPASWRWCLKATRDLIEYLEAQNNELSE